MCYSVMTQAYSEKRKEKKTYQLLVGRSTTELQETCGS